MYDAGGRGYQVGTLDKEDRTQAVLLRIVDLLARIDDPFAVLEECCRLVCAQLRASRVIFRLLNAEGEPAAPAAQAVAGVDPLQDPLRVSGFDPFASAQPMAGVQSVSDVNETVLSRFQKAAHERAGIVSWIAVSLLDEDRTCARLLIHHNVVRHWTGADIGVASIAAEGMQRASKRMFWFRGAALPRASWRREHLPPRSESAHWREALESAGLVIWEWDLQTNRISWSDTFSELQERASYEVWMERVYAEDRPELGRILLRARAERSHFVAEFRVPDPDGAIRWFAASGRYFGDPGRSARIVGVIREVTEGRNREEQQRVLAAEVEHRSRNLLTLVDVLIERCLKESTNLETFREVLRPRLRILALAQSLIRAEGPGPRMRLDELVRAELTVVAPQSARIELDGPADVWLSSSMAQILALAVHELYTNSVKYGAIARGGLLQVFWQVKRTGQGSPTMVLLWRESGLGPAPPAAARAGSGFGRELIEKALPFQFGARTSYRFTDDGLECTIEIDEHHSA